MHEDGVVVDEITTIISNTGNVAKEMALRETKERGI